MEYLKLQDVFNSGGRKHKTADISLKALIRAFKKMKQWDPLISSAGKRLSNCLKCKDNGFGFQTIGRGESGEVSPLMARWEMGQARKDREEP